MITNKGGIALEHNIEIFLADLNEEKQAEILRLLGDNGNYDTYPIAVIPVETEIAIDESDNNG
jgi:hypothetical protein